VLVMLQRIPLLTEAGWCWPWLKELQSERATHGATPPRADACGMRAWAAILDLIGKQRESQSASYSVGFSVSAEMHGLAPSRQSNTSIHTSFRATEQPRFAHHCSFCAQITLFHCVHSARSLDVHAIAFGTLLDRHRERYVLNPQAMYASGTGKRPACRHFVDLSADIPRRKECRGLWEHEPCSLTGPQ
jgi:hypothetical protein